MTTIKNKSIEKNYSEFAKFIRLSNCQKCELANTRNNIVVDRGNPKAKLLIVGEAPGKNEDESGKPFVGRAGKVLDEMMLTINIETDQDALIVNIIKCRPPKNRVPKIKEVAECIPYLHHQIELLKPKTIVLLGATAFKRLLPDIKFSSMKDIVGRVFKDKQFNEINLVALFHPAYLLYDPRKKEEMKKHLKQLRASNVL